MRDGGTEDYVFLRPYKLVVSCGCRVVGTLPREIFRVLVRVRTMDCGDLDMVLAAGVGVHAGDILCCDLKARVGG